jgi:nitrous oxide reductase accessory protein NosL
LRFKAGNNDYEAQFSLFILDIGDEVGKDRNKYRQIKEMQNFSRRDEEKDHRKIYVKQMGKKSRRHESL